jgi:hypothetical protein
MNVELTIQEAQKLFDSYKGPGSAIRGIGREVVAIILQERTLEELSQQETKVLLKGYSWAGEHQIAYSVAITAVQKWGGEFMSDLTRELHHCFWWPGDRFLTEVDRLILTGVGDPVHWHLQKAWFLSMEATGERAHDPERQGEWDWRPGDPVLNSDALRLAALELEEALSTGIPASSPYLEDWNEQFKCIVSDEKYAYLKRGASDICGSER